MKLVLALVFTAIMAAPGSAATSAKPAAPPATTPAYLQGNWFALSTTAMGIMGDVGFSNGQMRTSRGAVPVQLSPIALQGFNRRAWLTPMNASVIKLLKHHSRLCGGTGDPEDVRWILIIERTFNDPDDGPTPMIEIFPFSGRNPPSRASYDEPGTCGSMDFVKMHPGEALDSPPAKEKPAGKAKPH